MIEFDPGVHIRNILLVGVGGTGSQLARSISRMLYDMRSRNLEIPRLFLIDPDMVELKNVGRQMFTVADVGRPKAEVLGERFSRALGIEVVWRVEPFSSDRMIDYGLLVGAVDNHAARCELAKVRNTVWIDCGNHFSSGQVVIGNRGSLDYVIGHLSWLISHRDLKHGFSVDALPNAAALFPALLEPEPETTPAVSCADLISIGEQHLLINDMVAAVAANYIYKLLHRQPITSFVSFVDLDGMNVKSVPITPENLQAYLPTKDAA